MTRAALSAALLSIVIAGCTTARKPAPVSDVTPPKARTAPSAAAAKPAPRATDAARPETYTVKPGDTLYSIAADHGLDYRELAAWNNLDNAGVILVGQQLRLTAPPATTGVTTAPLKGPIDAVEARPLDARGPSGRPLPPPGGTAAAPGQQPPGAAAEKLKTGPKAVRVPYSEQAWAQANSRSEAVAAAPKVEAKPEPKADAKPEPKPEAKAEAKSDAAREAGDIDWIWPTSGKVIATFNGTTSKGIDIAGKMGQPVLATAAGRVIYSGTGPRGLGKFIVIRHGNDYISIYGNNRNLLVKESQNVAKGQQIAEMGDSEADQVKLHFEIRRFSKPLDPIKLLPDRG